MTAFDPKRSFAVSVESQQSANGIPMTRLLSFALATLFSVLATDNCYASESVPAWLVGTWTVTYDEDGTPADVETFTSDGRYINYGIGCSIREEMPFHMYAGDIYVTIEITGKGPTAGVFRPSKDHRKLTYTSPRTRHNAVLERLPLNPCGKKG